MVVVQALPLTSGCVRPCQPMDIDPPSKVTVAGCSRTVLENYLEYGVHLAIEQVVSGALCLLLLRREIFSSVCKIEIVETHIKKPSIALNKKLTVIPKTLG